MSSYKFEYQTSMRTIEPGMQIRCLRKVTFADGTEHGRNDILLVTEENVTYYQRTVDNKTYEVFG